MEELVHAFLKIMRLFHGKSSKLLQSNLKLLSAWTAYWSLKEEQLDPDEKLMALTEWDTIETRPYLKCIFEGDPTSLYAKYFQNTTMHIETLIWKHEFYIIENLFLTP